MDENFQRRRGYMDYGHEEQLKRSSSAASTARSPNCGHDMGKPNPEQSDQLRAGAHRLQPNIAVQLARGQRPRGLQVGWDNEMQSEGKARAWESAVSIFHKTWGYANWDDAAPTYKDTSYPVDYTEEDWDHISRSTTTRPYVRLGGCRTKTTEIVGNMFSTVALGPVPLQRRPEFDGSYDPWGCLGLKGIGDWNRAHTQYPQQLARPFPHRNLGQDHGR